MTRKRSVVWGYFKSVDSELVQCVLCRDHVGKHERGTTTAMLRHLRAKHPTEVGIPKKVVGRGRKVQSDSSSGPQDMGTDSEQFCSVEVALEEDDSHTISKVDEADINLAIDGFLESAQEGQLGQRTEEGSSGHLPEKPKRSPRSLIWRHFERSDSSGSARCRICKKELQFFDGSTSNLHRHMLKKHPGLSLRAGNMLKPPSSNPPSGLNDNSDNLVSVGLTDQSEFSEQMPIEEEDSHTINTVNETDINLSINGILEAAQGGPVEQRAEEGAIGQLSVKSKRSARSLIWRHFENLKSLGAARCQICKKKLRCRSGSTGNLLRHMSKRHPEVSLRAGNVPTPLQFNLTKGSNDSDSAKTLVREQRQFSDVIRVSQTSGEERRVFKRERELIEALRRAQKQEAQALEHQRELLEKLHAVNTREAAAEKKEIESLRKAQQEEAEDLKKQKEELETEKGDLQKKWEELQQEKEVLLLLTREHEAPKTCDILTLPHQD